MTQATSLAKLQEDKINDRRRAFKGKHFPTTSTSSTNTTPNTQPPLLPTPKIQFKKISPEEMAARREKGLCYNCDDKFSPGHKCKGRFFLIIAENEDDSEPQSPPPSLPNISEELPAAQISLNALSGTPAPETFRLCGQIGCSRVTILIDGGSTHNFMQTRVAKFLQLPTTSTPALKVTVGNGTTLDCCLSAPIHLSLFRATLLTWIFMYSLLAVPT